VTIVTVEDVTIIGNGGGSSRQLDTYTTQARRQLAGGRRAGVRVEYLVGVSGGKSTLVDMKQYLRYLGEGGEFAYSLEESISRNGGEVDTAIEVSAWCLDLQTKCGNESVDLHDTSHFLAGGAI
jgi:hypothetical protein